jgi:hypothetical protein
LREHIEQWLVFSLFGGGILMKMWRIISFALVALLVLAGPVHAQDEPYTFCGDLSEADCEILIDTAAAMQALESTTFQLEADLNVSNIPDAPFDTLNLRLTGDGSFAADVTPFLDLQPEAVVGGEIEFFPLMADLLRTVAADMTLTLELPEELIALAETDEQQLPDTITLSFRMVDGVAYVNTEDLAEVAPEGSVPSGWLGIDLAELYGSVLPEMYEGSMVGFDIGPMVSALMQPENMAQFVAIERLPDAEIEGQAMAVFETRMDYAGMLDIPAFRDMLQSVLEQEEEADIEAAMEAIRAMYEGMTLVITQSIGLEDMLVHQTRLVMEWDLASFAEVAEQEAAPQFSFDLSVTQEAFNTAPEVVAPEEAILLPIQQMLPSPERSS